MRSGSSSWLNLSNLAAARNAGKMPALMGGDSSFWLGGPIQGGL